jgi:hypothetical protein
MLDIITKAINKFYKEKDYTSFKELCMKQLPLFEKLKKYIDKCGFRSEATFDCTVYPSKRWDIHFDDYKNGELEITYKTILKVSKVAPLYYVQHEFSIKNKDANGLDPYLEGFDNGTCIKQQFDLNEEIDAILNKKGYTRLEYRNMIEAVPGFKMPKTHVEKLGHNVTVEHLLFMDLFDICKTGLISK